MNWIDIKTKEPKVGDVVDVWHVKHGRVTDIIWSESSDEDEDEEITHWMPIPQIPGEENKDFYCPMTIKNIQTNLIEQIENRRQRMEDYKDDPDQVTAFENQIKHFEFIQLYFKAF